MAVCFSWSMVQRLLPKNLTSFIDGFAIEFDQVESFIKIFFKTTFTRTKIIVSLKTEETCNCSLLRLLLLHTHPYRVNETEKYSKGASMKDMLETSKLSQA